MDGQVWKGIAAVWSTIGTVITFKLSFIILLLLFYFIYKTVKDIKADKG